MSSRKFISIVFSLSLLLIVVSSGCAAKQETPQPIQPQIEVTQPVISNLQADRQVAALGTTQIVCTAAEDGTDNLTYTWAATGGTLAGAGSTVSWTAPEKSGDYLITVVVSDGKGEAAKKSVIINVPEKPNNPPVIEALRFTRPKRAPITIKPIMTDAEKKKLPELVAIKYDVVELSCMASDADKDKLDYVWQATGGKLVGSGANMQWIAAGEPGIYTISVEVLDDKGASATFQITVSVHCCSG